MDREERKRRKEIEKLKKKLNRDLQDLSDPRQRRWFSMTDPDEHLEAWKKDIQKQIDKLNKNEIKKSRICFEEKTDQSINDSSKAIDELIEWAKQELSKPIKLVLEKTEFTTKRTQSQEESTQEEQTPEQEIAQNMLDAFEAGDMFEFIRYKTQLEAHYSEKGIFMI